MGKDSLLDSSYTLDLLRISDLFEIKRLEDCCWIPKLRASEETFRLRMELGHQIIGLKYRDRLIGKVCFSFANFDPNLSPERQGFPQKFADFSLLPCAVPADAAFVYDLSITPHHRSVENVKRLIDEGMLLLLSSQCRYAVADVRTPSYAGSSAPEENRRQDAAIRQVLDSYREDENKIIPVRDGDQPILLREPVMRLYHQLAGFNPVWIAKDFLPADQPSGGYRIIAYTTLKEPAVSLSEEWMAISRSYWGEQYIEELAVFLRGHNVRTVLECGCGDGHVLEGLAVRGFGCVGIDSDMEMIAEARRNASSSTRYVFLDWLQLGRYSDQFDAVLCRGNSLTSVNSWGKEGIDPNGTEAAMRQSLQLMLEKVGPGGLLYIDTVRQRDIDQGDSTTNIDLLDVSIRGEVSYDWEKRIRKLSGGGTVKGQPFRGESCSYLLSPDELSEMLRSVGAKEVWPEQFASEMIYQIVCARI